MDRQVRLTVLSDTAGLEWLGSSGHQTRAMLKQARAWGLRDIDLKTVCRKNVIDLSDREVAQVARALADADIAVEAFSTSLFKRRIEDGPSGFREEIAALGRALEIARILQPSKIRLLGADIPERRLTANSISLVKTSAPWLLDFYREAIDMIDAAGIEAVIENETHGCLFSNPDEVLDFFGSVDRAHKVRFTWDVQNMWAMGVFPTIEIYRRLAPVIGCVHLKGGRRAPGTSMLAYRSALEHADWPVVEIVSEMLADAISPVICLNPPLGAVAAGDVAEDVTAQDIDFLRGQFPFAFARPQLSRLAPAWPHPVAVVGIRRHIALT